jgi:hypothetical protein
MGDPKKLVLGPHHKGLADSMQSMAARRPKSLGGECGNFMMLNLLSTPLGRFEYQQ